MRTESAPVTSKKLSLLKQGQISSLVYHDIFDYPLKQSELVKWFAGKKIRVNTNNIKITKNNGLYYLKGRKGLIYKRILRGKTSKYKMTKAIKASKLLALIPSVKMVAVTGALAMENASGTSDIDLMIVTSRNLMWTTRLVVIVALYIFRIPRRRPDDKIQEDKLCLNMWVDESFLRWSGKKNAYTAHEISQIKPIINKDNTYEKYIFTNKWIKDYWPNATTYKKVVTKTLPKPFVFVPLLEEFTRKIQYEYMKKKITNEVISPKTARFHPLDWGEAVLSRLR